MAVEPAQGYFILRTLFLFFTFLCQKDFIDKKEAVCAKRLLTKQLKFNRFWDEYDRVIVVPVNFIEVIRKYQGRLGLDDLSLETILNKYGEGVKEDSFENVQGMRMCTVTAARKLHMNPRVRY